jgi:glutamine amidotransferase-like uncharacterized protein
MARPTVERLVRASCLALLWLATACDGAAPLDADPPAPILLFDGTGTSANDVAAIAALLEDEDLRYSTVDSAELNAMSAARLRSHELLIVPGGNFVTMGQSLSARTTAKVREAVHDGLGYLGICAGAFLAGRFPRYEAFDLTGVQFGFYAASDRGIRKMAVAIARPGLPAFDHYWEDGPELGGWGDVVARYPDGTAAIAEGTSGRGWVILSGIHPEAPESWREGMSFRTPAGVANDYALTLIRAALEQRRLPHF